MKTEIKIDRLKVFARHGVLPQERVVGNDFEVTVSVTADLDPASIGRDELEGTVNYADIVAIIRREMSVPSMLIENVAWRVANALMRDLPPVDGCVVTVAKLLPPIASAQMRSASVTITLP